MKGKGKGERRNGREERKGGKRGRKGRGGGKRGRGKGGPLALRPSHYLRPQTRPRSGIFYLQTLDPPDLRLSDLRPYCMSPNRVLSNIKALYKL